MSVFERVSHIEENVCVVNRLLQEVTTHPCQSCGKCLFGYEGVTQLQMILQGVVRKKGDPEDRQLLEDVGGYLEEQSLCEEGEDLGKAVLYCLANYEKDFADHILRKACRAETCSSFLTFHVLASRCKGCGACEKSCPEEAILGREGQIHVIDLKLCTQCGECLQSCAQEAIITAGLTKPRGPKKPVPVKK